MHTYVTERERPQRLTMDVPYRPPADVAELLDERRAELSQCESALSSLTGREEVEEVVSLLARREALSLLVKVLATPPRVSASASLRAAWGPTRPEPTPEERERARLEAQRDLLRRQLSGEEEIPLTEMQSGALYGFPDVGGRMRNEFKEENRKRVERELAEVESKLAAPEDDEDEREYLSD